MQDSGSLMAEDENEEDKRKDIFRNLCDMRNL